MPGARRILSAWGLAALLLIGGCKSDKTPGKAKGTTAVQAALPLRVLVVDDPEMAEVVEREWNARAEGQCKIRQTTTDELLGSEEKRIGADVVIYPSGLLGELATRGLIRPIAREDLNDPGFDRRDIFESLRLREVTWGKKAYAVTFGSPQFTLLYRQDLFAALQLEPPTSWSEYESMAEQLSDRDAVGEFAPGGDQPWSGTAEPRADGWAGQLLLARAAAYARHRNQYSTIFNFKSMEPLIDGPGFVRAMEELAVAAKHDPESSLSPTEVRGLFLAGQCAMALTWPSHAEDVSAESEHGRENWIGVAELPGAKDVYNFRTKKWEQREASTSGRVTLLAVAGRLGSVTEECRRSQQALAMLMLLTGDEIGTAVASESKHTTLFRESQLTSAGQWVDAAFDSEAARQYGEVVQSAQNRSTWLASVRIPGRAQYLAALDDAVEAVIAGNSTAEDALTAAAESWRTTTKELGNDQQREAYTRSLGLEP